MPDANVVMLSMWRNDAHRQLERRAHHLLAKTYPALRWVWVVGDSEDSTEWRLWSAVIHRQMQDRVTIVRQDTGILGEDPAPRLRRLSLTANAYWPQIRPSDTYAILHESDIRSPLDLVERFLVTGLCPVAAWPVLERDGTRLFYDTWAYRQDGQMFVNWAPYHPVYRPDEPFEVDSVGTCWMFHAQDMLPAGPHCDTHGTIDICRRLRARGRRIWVDPRIVVEQPEDLWVLRSHYNV